ncbi:Probable polyol transporter 6 [Linum perenne]
MYQRRILSTIQKVKVRSPTPSSDVIFLAVIVSFPFFLHGYDVMIARATTSIEDDLSLTVGQLDSYITTANRLFLAVGVLVAGVAANFVGRIYTAAFGGGVYTLGALIMSFSHGYWVSVSGRALTGFGTGMGLLVGPIYIAEISPARFRSFVGHFPQVMLAMGMMSAYTLESAFTRLHPHIAWRLTIGLSALPTLAFTGLLFVIQDTPCWLVMMGKVSLAKQLLEYYGAREEEDSDDDEEEEEEVDEVEVRMTQLKKAAGLDPHCTGNNVSGAPGRIIGVRALFDDMFNGDHIFRPLLKTTLLLIVQEAIFEDLVLQTFDEVLGRNGFRCCLPSSIAGIMISCMKLLFTLFSSLWANERGGRKGLLVFSIFLAGCSLGAFSATIFADGHDLISHATAFAFYSVEIVALEVAVGFGIEPYPWMYGPEAFPLAIRAPCLALCIVPKYAFRFFLNLLLPVLYAPFEGMWVAFLVASGTQAVSLVLCYFLIRDSTSQILVDHID